MKLPKARNENIVVNELKDEVLVYDLTTSEAFCLNETSSKVFNACNGETTFADLRTKNKLTNDVIYLALDGLKKKNLIDGDYTSPFAGMNRREVIRKVGLASMIALPMISALVAPPAAHAASGAGLLPNGSACTQATASSCASGNCSSPKSACCTRVNGSADNVPCTSTTDCCLSVTTSACTNGKCCRIPGAIAGFAPSGNGALCCSGSCNYTSPNAGPCVCT